MSVEIVPLGDSAITITFGHKIEERIHHQIKQFSQIFISQKIHGVLECTQAYTTVSIFYDPTVLSYTEIKKRVLTIYKSAMESQPIQSIVYRIPVYYGGRTGPDLGFIAKYNNMSEQEVIHTHVNKEYLIHMIGFVPGFPYLGGLPNTIAAPRLKIPRAKIAAGSVGIGGNQTGIYPAEVPSGWRIIGITPLSLFNPESENPSLLSAGNFVSFYPVECEEYLSIKERVAAKEYDVVTYKKGE